MNKYFKWFLIAIGMLLIASFVTSILYNQYTNITQEEALNIKRECQKYTKEVTGLSEDSFESCYLEDLQVWAKCPSPELEKYNKILQECMEEKGVLEDPEWVPVP